MSKPDSDHSAMIIKISGLVIILWLATGCAGNPGVVAQTGYAECSQFFTKLDAAVDSAGVRDSGATRITGYRWLRVDRFLESYRGEALSDSGFQAWVDRMQKLDRDARRIEIRNLSAVQRASLLSTGDEFDVSVLRCGDVLRRADLSGNRQRLLDAIRTEPEYRTWKRVLGLYPFTALGVLVGVNSLHRDVNATFSREPTARRPAGVTVTYSPATKGGQVLSQEQVASILTTSARNPLRIPEPDADQSELLFTTFAPLWSVATLSDDDRIGEPAWHGSDRVTVDTNVATVYRRLSHVRFRGSVLLQLNYIIWFPSRPKSGWFDILGGHLDGITWRVTLDNDGRPLLYDAMHNCGCYHMFFPGEKLRIKRGGGFEEPLLVPAKAPALQAAQRVVLGIAPVSHYVESVGATVAGGDVVYGFDDYDVLRTLPLPAGGSRSLFRPDGIVDGTQRGERWILWPMGVPSPGEMRQWGHHATAFVGRRHFDDADLIERYFESVE